jgi:hypothetical protein
MAIVIGGIIIGYFGVCVTDSGDQLKKKSKKNQSSPISQSKSIK